MHNVCIFCKSKKLAIRYVVSDFHILQCKECGLSFVGEVLSKEELIPYYEKQKLDVSVYSDEANKENLKYYYSKIADHICQRVPTGKILDVGCSSGYFLDCMLEYGWECHGIEMMPVMPRGLGVSMGAIFPEVPLKSMNVPKIFLMLLACRTSWTICPIRLKPWPSVTIS